VGLGVLILALLLLDARRVETQLTTSRSHASLSPAAPALFNEARYARHAGEADRHAAFQDHPMALEHFPAGSLMPPPEHERLD
jgi:hypothetical protein